ncbi:MAG: hypothetical protein V4503_04365 [Gemmatimonadota bacterium]
MWWGGVVAVLALATPQSQVTLEGRVVRVAGRDTVAVAGVPVILHRVTPAKQGPIDSIRTGSDGRFRFRLVRDSGAIYLTSARWAGIEYFAAPVTFQAAVPDTVSLVVADTSSSAPITIAARHIVVSAPASDGTRAVLELLVIENAGELTRVAGRGTSWSLHLPPDAAGVTLGEMDFAADAVEVHRDTVLITAALPPGQRELTLQYQLPAGLRAWTIPVEDSIGAMNVLLEESSARVTGPLVPADSQVVEGRRYFRWQGNAPRGARVLVTFAESGTPSWLLPLLVASLGLGLLATFVVAQRRRPAAAPPRFTPAAQLPPDVEGLLRRIAELDRVHAGGPAHHLPEVWHAYLRERAELKRQLEEHLPL